LDKLTKLLVICVDAGDSGLIARWAAEGTLPTFRSLLDRGMSGPTTNPVGLYVGAVWPSFWTSLPPTRHRRYCYSQIEPGSYKEKWTHSRDTVGRPFWDELSLQGRRVAILDVPKTVVSPVVNGIHLVDWGTHDPEGGPVTSPPSLAGEVEARFGRYPVRSCDEHRSETAEFTALRDGLLRGVALKTELSSHFLAQGGWDLFLTVFAEAHCAGHQFWHLHDRLHPRHDFEMTRDLGDPLRDVYVAIDTGIARLLAQAGEDTSVLVLASHGMGPHYDGTYMLERILQARERAEMPKGTLAAARVLEWGWERLPRPARRLFRSLRAPVKQRLGDALVEPDSESRRCYASPNNDAYGAVRVNLVGREPRGLVHPGPEFERFCDELERDLLTLVNVDTGRRLVRRVLRMSDAYPGEPIDHLPDLLIEWDRGAPVSTVYSPKTGTIRDQWAGNRTGDHQASGLLIAAGPGFGSERLSSAVDVTQIGPTIAALLGVTLADGTSAPVRELLSDAAGLKN
jgi:predicted AlkP superfamily phosphohydrolase/phosphomutase